MKRGIFIVAVGAMLVPLVASAWMYDVAMGRNRAGETIRLEGDGTTGTLTVERSGGRTRSYDLRRYCPAFVQVVTGGNAERGVTTFRCPVHAGFPLSGATYRVTLSKKHRDVCGGPYVVYRCIRGCDGAHAVKEFEEEPYEC